jgi:hypothetical protein
MLDLELLRRALLLRPSDTDDPSEDWAVEKMGDEAFDWLTAYVAQRSNGAAERARGLRLLARLTRQFCFRRKGELLDLALRVAAGDPDTNVRSVATHVALISYGISKGLGDPYEAFGKSVPQIQALLLVAVKAARALGLPPDVDELAARFIENESATHEG